MTQLPAKITAHPRYTAITEARTREAQAAAAARSMFQNLTIGFIAATVLASVVGGCLLFGVGFEEASSTQTHFLAETTVKNWLLGVQGVLLAVAAGCAYKLGTKDYYRNHTTHRIAAEEGRWARETTALELAHEQGPEVFLAAGEAFKNFLKGQMEHHDGSSKRQGRKSNRLSVIGAFVAAISALLAVIVEIDWPPALISIAVVSVCLPGLAALMENWSDRRASAARADLHGETWKRLNALRGEITEFDNAVQANDLPGALAYVDRLIAVLREDLIGFAAIRGIATQANASDAAQ